MVVINLGYTAPVNPPGAEPVLTPGQVWEGLQYKVRRAEKFVPIITACEVLSETKPSSSSSSAAEEEHVITRHVTFQPGAAGRPVAAGETTVKEVCKLYAPCRVDFHQEDGSTIGNYVTRDAEGQLMMTYVFQWRLPGVEEGSAEAKSLEEKYAQVSLFGCCS